MCKKYNIDCDFENKNGISFRIIARCSHAKNSKYVKYVTGDLDFIAGELYVDISFSNVYIGNIEFKIDAKYSIHFSGDSGIHIDAFSLLCLISKNDKALEINEFTPEEAVIIKDNIPKAIEYLAEIYDIVTDILTNTANTTSKELGVLIRLGLPDNSKD